MPRKRAPKIQITKTNWKKRRKKHDEIVQNWHLNNDDLTSRESRLIFGLSEESNFNDVFVKSFVSDDPELLCFKIGG